MDIKQVFPTSPISGASHSEQQSLLAAIITSPDEDTPRSMYADFLLDSSDMLDRKLGEYIKLSLELHQHKQLTQPRKDNNLKGIEYRNDGYQATNSYSWYRRGIELREQINEGWVVVKTHPSLLPYHYTDITEYPYAKRLEFEVDRGFISSITCTASQFLSICDKLVWHPSMVDEVKKYMRNGKVKLLSSVARPCPLTAHPVREIEITDIQNRSSEEYNIDLWLRKLAPNYGIEFTIV